MSLPNSANGLLVELERRMNEYFDWVRDRTVLKQVEGGREYVEITTPHLDRHNDCIQFYVGGTTEPTCSPMMARPSTIWKCPVASSIAQSGKSCSV
jgi:hypothetical protein